MDPRHAWRIRAGPWSARNGAAIPEQQRAAEAVRHPDQGSASEAHHGHIFREPVQSGSLADCQIDWMSCEIVNAGDSSSL